MDQNVTQRKHCSRGDNFDLSIYRPTWRVIFISYRKILMLRTRKGNLSVPVPAIFNRTQWDHGIDEVPDETNFPPDDCGWVCKMFVF
jgi:hypothetical protein